jgi:acetylornithine deacetylase/succinyl-diaminopimelate desuccinylase-like protein
MINLQQVSVMINDDNLTETLSDIVNIASPTGEERLLAEHIANQLSRYGLKADVQMIDDKQANALGFLQSKRGGGTSLLLYSPLDTVTSNSESEDLPWIGSELRFDMRAKSRIVDGHLFGLGAHNPKGHAACIIEAARILKALALPLSGDIYFGFGAGGMPTHSRKNIRSDSGHGAGCAHLLRKIPTPDSAIVVKSGFAVTWEEVGFLWMDVTVEGTHTYVGSIHLLPYQSAISSAAKLIIKLEEWFEKRSDDLSTDCVKPQAVVSFIQSGWERMPAFTPASCRFRLDLRFGPDQIGDDAEAEFQQVLRQFCDELKISASSQRVQMIEASRTDIDAEIIKTTIRSWEEVKGRPHLPFNEMSGATDANIMRQHGVPTARMGLPKADLPDLDFQLGMNAVALSDMRDLTAMLVMSSIKYCGEAVCG